MTTTHRQVRPRKQGPERSAEFQFSPRIRLTCERVTMHDHKGKPYTIVTGTPLRLDGKRGRVAFRGAYIDSMDLPVIEVAMPNGNIRQVRPEKLRTLTGRAYQPSKEAS